VLAGNRCAPETKSIASFVG
jgi:hypothetical protein